MAKKSRPKVDAALGRRRFLAASGAVAGTTADAVTLGAPERLAGGLTLGPVGGRIVGEVFIGLLQLDSDSYLAVDPNWTPTLPSQTPGDFRLTDLPRFAGADPISRGQ